MKLKLRFNKRADLYDENTSQIEIDNSENREHFKSGHLEIRKAIEGKQ